MTDRIPPMPRIKLAFKDEAMNPAPMNTATEWLSRVGRETPVMRRAVLDITTPAVGANSLLLSRDAYTANATNAWGLTGSHVDNLVVPIFEDVIIAHWDYRPVWPLALPATPALALVSIQIHAVGTVQCLWSNPTGGAHAGGATQSYEVILLRA